MYRDPLSAGIMKAVIMAGGFGTRLRPLTWNLPKPMAPLMNKPMMHHIVTLLRSHGITEIIATLFYHPEHIASYFGNGERFGVKMKYVKAEEDYGTAGSVRNAAAVSGELSERFIVISGDVLTDFDLSKAIDFHEERKASATVILKHSSNPLQYGVVITDSDGKIKRFLEKPSWGEVFSDTINTGIYILEPEVLDLIPLREEFDFSRNLFPLLLEREAGLYGYSADGYWRDIGNLNEYQEAHWDCLAGKVNINIEGSVEKLAHGRLYYESNTIIRTSKTNLRGSIVLGNNVTIHEGARITSSVVGDNCIIGRGAIIENSILWDNVRVGDYAVLSSDVVGSDSSIGARAEIAEYVFMGERCIIGKGAKLAANIKLWPEKVVEDGAVLSRSLVWEDKWLRELFTHARVSGISNIEMNPEFGAKLGAAFGASVGVGKTVATSRDADPVSRMMNRALICGLISAGVNVVDLRTTSIPMLRHELRAGREAGGIHVRKSPYDKTMTDIIFFDANGIDLSISKTKSIERLFFSEDFLRAPYDQVGTISFSDRVHESYQEKFLSMLDTAAIERARFRIVLDYSNGIAATLFPNILGALGCQAVALNAYIDPRRLTRTKEEIRSAIEQLSHIVTSLHCDAGWMIDAGGEKLSVVDEQGYFIEPQRLLSLVTRLYLEANPSVKRIAVPISATREVDLVAQERGVQIIRTKDSHLSMMKAALDDDIPFVGGTRGGFIFTEFLFASDAMFAVAKIMELMALTGWRLGSLNENTPSLYRVTREVPCPWSMRGHVMRRVIEHTEQMERDLIDGVKVYRHVDKAIYSALFLPDPTRPIFTVLAEGPDAAITEALANEYEEKLRTWKEEHPNS